MRAQVALILRCRNCGSTNVEDVPPRAQAGFVMRREKIEALRSLGQNWNSYGCEEFSKESVDAALALEPSIPAEFDSIVPIAGGGVQFGKNGDEVTIEVFAAAPEVQKGKGS